MALNRKIKAPKVFQGTPGKASRFARSSTKAPKPKGINPSDPSYGITQTGARTVEQTAARAGSLFKNGSRNTPTGQDLLTSKVKRQAY